MLASAKPQGRRSMGECTAGRSGGEIVGWLQIGRMMHVQGTGYQDSRHIASMLAELPALGFDSGGATGQSLAHDPRST